MRTFLGPVIVAAAMAISSFSWLPSGGVDAQVTPQASARPQGWDRRTHEDDALPDYATLFALDRVHELQIVVSADNYRRMQDDLTEVVPMAGFMRHGPSGAPPQAGPQKPGGEHRVPASSIADGI